MQTLVLRSRPIFLASAADNQGAQRKGVAIGIDSSDTGGTSRFFHLVKSIEQRENLLVLDLLPTLPERNLIVQWGTELSDEPFLQRALPLRPGGEWKYDGKWLMRLVSCG
jgi:hypothetical protein